MGLRAKVSTRARHRNAREPEAEERNDQRPDVFMMYLRIGLNEPPTPDDHFGQYLEKKSGRAQNPACLRCGGMIRTEMNSMTGSE
jgi:hypothetical protein